VRATETWSRRWAGQLEVDKLVAERQHGGAGGESGRDDEIVVPELDAPKLCEDDPRGDLENAKTVCQEVLQCCRNQRGNAGGLPRTGSPPTRAWPPAGSTTRSRLAAC
jgi:hypothetical protein